MSEPEVADRIAKIEERFELLEQRCDDLMAKVNGWPSSRSASSEVQQRFAELVSEWRRTRGHSPKIKDLVMNSAYQRIIGMGEPAIPLILREMEREPDHWSWAMTAISGEDPVPHTARGRLDQTTAAWVKWAHEKGYR